MTADWVPRRDRGSPLLRMSRRDDGSILAEGIAVKPGILVYNENGRQVRELIRAATIARDAAGLARAPLTLGHPARDFSASTAYDDLVGDVDGEVHVDESGFLRVRVAIRRADAVHAVLSRDSVQLSPGYVTELGPGGVDPVFGAFDFEQLGRKYNHLSLVQVARGGPDVGLRVDGIGDWVDGVPEDPGPGPKTSSRARYMASLGLHDAARPAAEPAEPARKLSQRQRYLRSLGLE